jgi:hypothetical protein
MMLFTIYGLRVAGSEHVFLIGQTHQQLSKRKRGHIERAKAMFANGFHTPKTQVIMQALQTGQDIEIVKIDEIEAHPRYATMRDGSPGYALASDPVNERERFWQQTYLRNQGGPMVLGSDLVFSWGLVPIPQD